MKLKEKIQRLRTSLVNQKGFTLVELIVVIAILGILAGVAVPVYSGYIKKANMAADLQLLSAVNTAFASACLENGESAMNRTDDPKMPLNADGTVNVAEVTPANIQPSFAKFFAGNENAKFKVLKNGDLKYDKDKGVFKVDPTEMTAEYAETLAKLLSDEYKDQREAVKNLSMVNTMGVTGMVDEVFGITDAVNRFLNDPDNKYDKFTDLINGEEYWNTWVAIAGDEEKAMQMVVDEAVRIAGGLEKFGSYDPLHPTDEQKAWMNLANNKILANNAVLTVADKTAELNSSEFYNELVNEGFDASDFAEMVGNAGDGNNADVMAKGAATYAMYIAYANQLGEDQKAEKDRILELGYEDAMTNASSDTGFMDYLESPQGKTDFEGYFAAMEMISGGVNNETKKDILINGINSDNKQLLALMNQVVGTK